MGFQSNDHSGIFFLELKCFLELEWNSRPVYFSYIVLRNIFRNNIDDEIIIVRKTERNNETWL